MAALKQTALEHHFALPNTAARFIALNLKGDAEARARAAIRAGAWAMVLKKPVTRRLVEAMLDNEL